jgi:hypothetical protein
VYYDCVCMHISLSATTHGLISEKRETEIINPKP